jgi:RNA polymerase sigma-70 factor (ECF subfamily)
MAFNDLELFNAVKNKDIKSYRVLHSQYSERLYLYALKFVSNEQAKDIVQDIFLYIWTDARKIQITTSLKSYLYTLVKNKCLNLLKHDEIKHKYFDYALIQLKQIELEHYSSVETSLLEKEIDIEMQTHVNELPKQCQKVFKLSRFEHKKNAEIADELSISKKAVEKHITNALKILRKKMSKFLILIISLLSIFF